ncbi:MAG: cell wall-binding repeat-containing protein [Eubacteriales bacterium]
MFKKKVIAIAVTVLFLLISVTYPVQAVKIQTYQNPSLEEISRKLEIIAKAKLIPSVILKAIAFTETGWRQWDENGDLVVNNSGSRPSLGIMQITSYDSSDTETVNKLKSDIDFNIAYGADLLNDKWDMVPQIGDGDRDKLENWYFAIWAYNNYSSVNNPNTAAEKGKLAYQDKVLKYAATEYYTDVVTPISITPISASLLPAGTLPSKSITWETPEPVHIGDLKVGTNEAASRGEVQGSDIRIVGENSIDTANKIALTGWPNGCETVIITRSDDFPDALAGVPLAKKYNAPILVTTSDNLNDGVIEVLNKLKPVKIIMLGGEGALSQTVEQSLRKVASWTEDITRIAGVDRFETAALIADEFPVNGEVALATGMNFPDALSLASAAAGKGIPLLLLKKDSIPEVTEAFLKKTFPSSLYIAGGEAVISSKVVDRLSMVSGISLENIKRMSGPNRYDTSVKIAEEFYPQTESLYLATGQDFIDPLVAGALAAAKNSCLLLVSPNGFENNSPTENYLKTLPVTTNINVIGGEGVISDDTIIKTRALLGQT